MSRLNNAGRKTTIKAELIKRTAKRACVTSAMCGRIIDAFIDEIIASLVNGDKVCLDNFMIFDFVERRPRNGKDLNTGEAVVFPATNQVVCRLSNKVKQAIKEKKSEEKEA